VTAKMGVKVRLKAENGLFILFKNKKKIFLDNAIRRYGVTWRQVTT
jgi:hypothetical protein